MEPDIEEGLALAQVISAIKRELQNFVDKTSDEEDLDLPLTTVKVALAVKNVRTAKGEMGFGISFFGIGGKVGNAAEGSSEDVSTLTVELQPPKSTYTLEAEEEQSFAFTSTLIEARKQLLAGLKEEPKLTPTSLSLEIKFVVTKGGGPTSEFEFKIISGKAGASVSRADTQTITLVFEDDL